MASAHLLVCFHGSLLLKRYFFKFPLTLNAKLLLKNQWFATVMFAKKLNRYSTKKQWFTIVKFDKFFQIFFIKWTHEKEEFWGN